MPALTSLRGGRIHGAALSKARTHEANWIRTILIPLGLCSKLHEGTRVVYELTGDGFTLLAEMNERTPTTQERLLFAPLDHIGPIVARVTKDLSPGSGNRRDLDTHAEVLIRRRMAGLLAVLLRQTFPAIAPDAPPVVLHARGLWQP